MRLDENSVELIYKHNTMEEIVRKILRNESDEKQRDFEMLSCLISNSEIIIADIELIY